MFIHPYSDKIIEKLRNENFCGIPLSIVLLSSKMCKGYCHYMSAQLTKVLPNFKYVNADITYGDELINHTWVEVDNTVCDVTDSGTWDKEIYYAIYKPKIISVYDENNINSSSLYKMGISLGNDKYDIDIELLLAIIKLSEKESEFYDLLLREIELYRKNNNMTKEYYLPYLEKQSKKIFGQ